MKATVATSAFYFEFNSNHFYLYSNKWQEQFTQGVLYCEVNTIYKYYNTLKSEQEDWRTPFL